MKEQKYLICRETDNDLKAGNACVFDYLGKDQISGLLLARTLDIIRKVLYEHKEGYPKTYCPVGAGTRVGEPLKIALSNRRIK